MRSFGRGRHGQGRPKLISLLAAAAMSSDKTQMFSLLIAPNIKVAVSMDRPSAGDTATLIEWKNGASVFKNRLNLYAPTSLQAFPTGYLKFPVTVIHLQYLTGRSGMLLVTMLPKRGQPVTIRILTTSEAYSFDSRSQTITYRTYDYPTRKHSEVVGLIDFKARKINVVSTKALVDAAKTTLRQEVPGHEATRAGSS